MANHKRTKLLAEYEDAIHSLRYHEALKIVGALYYSCANEAREKEAQLLFLTKDYRRCVDLFSATAPITQRETELYIASLAMLRRHADVNSAIGESPSIGSYCYYYIHMNIENNDTGLPKLYNFASEVDDFFEVLLVKNIALQLARIFEELEEAKVLAASGVDVSSIIEANNAKLKKIALRDPYLSNIKREVSTKNSFDSGLIKCFVLTYLAHVNSEPSFLELFAPFKRMDDIIFYLDLQRRISPETAILETLVEYLEPIHDEAQNGNHAVALYLQELCITSENYPDISLDGETPIKNVWSAELSKKYPELASYADSVINTNAIKNKLSHKGVVAFNAAAWQYYATINDNYGIRDAGMLCLSYIRIIELELNVSVISHIKSKVDELLEIYEKECSSLTSNKKIKSFENKWKCLLDMKKSDQDLTLGSMWHLFNNLSTQRTEDAISRRIIEHLESILNQDGLAAMRRGRYAELICEEVRENFRNPPAHTRYVNKETAYDCKQYVENTIIELYSYLQH